MNFDSGVFFAILPYFTAFCAIIYFAHRSLMAEILANRAEILANRAEILANHRVVLSEIKTLAESIHGFDVRLSLVEQDVRRH